MNLQSSARAIQYGDPLASRLRLFQLHPTLSSERLLRVVAYGVAHIRDCTENDPPTGAGFIGWDKTIRALRDELAPLGWTRSNSKNFALTIAPADEFAIAVAAGDRFTGDPSAPIDPATKREKGAVTAEAVAINQLGLWNIQPNFPRPYSTLPTWYLLYHLDEITGEFRAELSFPLRVAADGRIVAWRERIILFQDGFTPVPLVRDDDEDDDDDYSIDVERIAN
jgi:hypothetical protein